MNLNTRLFVAVASALFAYGAGARIVRGQDPDLQSVTGQVYDLDFGGAPRSLTQVLLIGPANSNPALVTQSELVQGTLETAQVGAFDVNVVYRATGVNRGEISAVVLSLPVGARCSEDGCVRQIECSAALGECSVSVTGQPNQVKTKDVRALGIFLTAITAKKKTEELIHDKEGYISRVKVNTSGKQPVG